MTGSAIQQHIHLNVQLNKGNSRCQAATPSKHVWSIRTKLQVECRLRDLALFNVAIDRKLRRCDVVAPKVDDIAPSGDAADRASIGKRRLPEAIILQA
jgi:hypothetical protein